MKGLFTLTTVGAIVLSLGIQSPAAADEQSIANVVEQMVDSTKSTYSLLVVKKLENDGMGASSDHSSRKGFVPPPDAFLRRIAFDAIAKNKRSGEDQFRLTFAPGGEGRLTVKLENEVMTKDQEAMIVAKILDSMVRSIRGTYTAMVVHKLKQDDAGASLDYTDKSGFVPLPAVFVRNIASDVIAKQASSRGTEFALSLRSRWNLNPQQGLQGDFEQQGWQFLANQQDARSASGQSLRNYVWEPFTKTLAVDGKETLRYLSADVAADKSCVGCHNRWESDEKIQGRRASQGIEIAKVFNSHELMGAVSISVPLGE